MVTSVTYNLHIVAVFPIIVPHILIVTVQFHFASCRIMREFEKEQLWWLHMLSL